ncbi:MAG: hypothetical protein ACLR44_04720 [Clostridia bacterium]
MNDKLFENYKKRMLEAMQHPNEDKQDNIFSRLSNILDNLRNFVNTVTPYSSADFKEEVEKQFKAVDHSNETVKHFFRMLMDFSYDKKEALNTISELYGMAKPLSMQFSSWSTVSDIADEFIAEIQNEIFHH